MLNEARWHHSFSPWLWCKVGEEATPLYGHALSLLLLCFIFYEHYTLLSCAIKVLDKHDDMWSYNHIKNTNKPHPWPIIFNTIPEGVCQICKKKKKKEKYYNNKIKIKKACIGNGSNNIIFILISDFPVKFWMDVSQPVGCSLLTLSITLNEAKGKVGWERVFSFTNLTENNSSNISGVLGLRPGHPRWTSKSVWFEYICNSM